jgi:N4-gp56 family major capsid protein
MAVAGFPPGTSAFSRTAGASSHSVGSSTSANEAYPFIPELWSDEIIAAYKANLVVAPLVTKINHVGKKGDSIHIPRPNRQSASLKEGDKEVTLIIPTHNELNVIIDKHYEYSVLIEDIVDIQALDSMRRFYTDDAGYALAKRVDTDLLELAQLIGGNEGLDYVNAADIGGDGTTAYDGSNASVITDAGIRNALQTLDDADTPMDNRVLIVPPVEKNNLLGIARYTEQAFVGSGESIRNGQIGDIYGTPVFVSTNCPTAVSTDDARIATLMHKEAYILAEQMTVRSQTQYKQEFLADLMTSDTVYGVKGARIADVGDQSTAVVALAVPA